MNEVGFVTECEDDQVIVSFGDVKVKKKAYELEVLKEIEEEEERRGRKKKPGRGRKSADDNESSERVDNEIDLQCNKRNRGSSETTIEEIENVKTSNKKFKETKEEAEKEEENKENRKEIVNNEKHDAYIHARRNYISKFVRDLRKKYDNRPILSDWKLKLNELYANPRNHELTAARLFDDTVSFPTFFLKLIY